MTFNLELIVINTVWRFQGYEDQEGHAIEYEMSTLYKKFSHITFPELYEFPHIYGTVHMNSFGMEMGD